MEGTFDIKIHFTQDSLMKMRNLEGKFVKLQNFQPFWMQSGVIDDIKAEITKNLDQGMDPDMVPWAPLSPLYAARVGRTKMVVSSGSSIRIAYVYNPLIDASSTHLMYSANPAQEQISHLALRFGFMAGNTRVPGREWFGISTALEQKFQQKLDAFMTKALSRPGILGGAK